MTLRTLLMLWVTRVLVSAEEWELVSKPDFTAGKFSEQRPTKRYSHASAADGAYMYVSYGYHYDHARMKATWLQDVWKMSFQDFTWTQLHHGAEGDPSVMHARYKLSSVMHKDTLWFFGGDDGGGPVSSHMWGSYYNDLWTLDKEGIMGKVEARGEVPPPLAGHTAVVYKDRMYVFGGLTASEKSAQDNRFLVDTNNFFSFEFATATWEKLTPTPQIHARRSHGAAVVSDVMVVFGGFSKDERFSNMQDTHIFNFTTRHWQEVNIEGIKPSKRGAAAAAGDSRLGAFILMGGAKCVISCDCLNDLWIFNIHTQTWREVLPTAGSHIPVARHFHHGVLEPKTGYFYIFGGESYKPYAYWNDVWRIRLDGNGAMKEYVDKAEYHAGNTGGVDHMTNDLMFRTRDEDAERKVPFQKSFIQRKFNAPTEAAVDIPVVWWLAVGVVVKFICVRTVWHRFCRRQAQAKKDTNL